MRDTLVPVVFFIFLKKEEEEEERWVTSWSDADYSGKFLFLGSWVRLLSSTIRLHVN